MSRIIKFRAWDKNRDCMERFDLGHKDGLLYADGAWYVASGYDGEDNPKFEEDNVPSRYELMEFTGLLDKNNVEIYEGDIVEFISRQRTGTRYEGRGRGRREYGIHSEIIIRGIVRFGEFEPYKTERRDVSICFWIEVSDRSIAYETRFFAWDSKDPSKTITPNLSRILNLGFKYEVVGNIYETAEVQGKGVETPKSDTEQPS